MKEARAGAIGQSVLRREDERLLRGKGRYVDDLRLANAAHLVLVRSPHAHARVLAIDVSRTAQMPGVLGVLTGDDWDAEGFGELPCIWQVDSSDGTPMREASRPPLVSLAGGAAKVRHVGEPVVAVVANSAAEAIDAAEAITVEYEPLEAVVETRRALDADAPLVHERFRTNVCFDIEFGNRSAVQAAFAEAAHITTVELINNRLAPSPMEPRSTAGVHEPNDDHYTLWTSSQNPHLVRRWLAENSLRIPEHRVRVVSPDVGGGLGQKISHYPEEPLVLWSAKRFGRPVR